MMFLLAIARSVRSRSSLSRPAYASVGMLLEEKATPADDLYALGCVVYMAATSAHPYGRETALIARDKKLLVAKPTGLSKHKSSALCDVLNVCES